MRQLANAKVIICCGSGGVGKTSISAALGLMFANEGKQVLVLTIDPAKRLATTLGIVDNDIVEIPMAKNGRLFGAIIDSKKTFDLFIEKATRSSAAAAKILDNKLYQQLSTTLNGSQEFTALEKLYEAYVSQKFDMIILDTPPAKHAVDFLNSPQKISALFSDNVAKWFREPAKGGFWVSVVHQGTKRVFKVLETLTGSEFIGQLSDFFAHVESWQDKLQTRINEVHRLLVSPATQFVLVTGTDQAKLKEAEYLAREIRKGGYHFDHVIVNRAFPYGIDLQKVLSGLGGDPVVNYLERLRLHLLEKVNYLGKFVDKAKGNYHLVQIPEFDANISDLEGVRVLAEELKKHFA